MPKETINAPGVPVSFRPFSPAIRANGFVFVSGQASVDDEGNIVPGTFKEEFTRSFDNVKKVLAGAGLTLDDVVQVRSYIRDPADGKEYNELYRELFNEPFPARTTISNCLPETLRFEVEVVALDR